MLIFKLHINFVSIIQLSQKNLLRPELPIKTIEQCPLTANFWKKSLTMTKNLLMLCKNISSQKSSALT